MRVHWFQHAEHEGLGIIGDWLTRRGHRVSATRLQRGETPPRADQFDWLIVMGGPMNIYEEALYPWLAVEKQVIRDAIGQNRRLLGICLGSQLIADALGGPVTRNAHSEIGWLELHREPGAQQSPLTADWPERFTAFHWHGDTFALPPGAQHIASSEGCRNQGYVYGDRVVGLQFHPEVTQADVATWLEQPDGVPPPARYVQTGEVMLGTQAYYARMHALMSQLLEKLAAAR